MGSSRASRRASHLTTESKGASRIVQDQSAAAVALGRPVRRRDSWHSRGGVISLDHIPTQHQIGLCIYGTTPLATTAVHNCFRRGFRCPSVPFATIEDDPDIAPVPKVMAQFCVSVEAAARDDDKEHRRSSAAGSPTRSRPRHVGDILGSLGSRAQRAHLTPVRSRQATRRGGGRSVVNMSRPSNVRGKRAP